MAARKNGWMDEIRPMMKVMKKSWTKDELINLAQNYDNKTFPRFINYDDLKGVTIIYPIEL
jgi:hypothetical protein